MHLLLIGDKMDYIVETERLLIRRFKKTDIMSFYKYRQDKDVAKFQSWNHANFLETMQVLNEILNSNFDWKKGSVQFAIERKDIQYHIGDIYIAIDEHQPLNCFLGYTLAKECWGYGYAQEACVGILSHIFKNTDIYEVHALILPGNKRSLKLIEKLGFQHIGGIEYCLRRPQLYDDRYNLENMYP